MSFAHFCGDTMTNIELICILMQLPPDDEVKAWGMNPFDRLGGVIETVEYDPESNTIDIDGVTK